MRRDSLRQPTRPPPIFNPAVESWLDGLPFSATKPSPQELRQWNLKRRDSSGRGSFVASIILRVISLVFSLTVTFLALSIVVPAVFPVVVVRLVPALVACPIAATWNAAEFIIVCSLRGKGLPPKAHAWADALLFLGLTASTGFILVDVIIGASNLGGRSESARREIACACLLIIIMLIHSFFLFFFLYSHFDNRRKKSAPRIVSPVGLIAAANSVSIGETNPHTAAELSTLQRPVSVQRPSLKMDVQASSYPSDGGIVIDQAQISQSHGHAAAAVPQSPMDTSPLSPHKIV
ncbi:hypothetical protein B0T25DRAFT_533039 [Lasiosphaeria hispida]|uniref:Uncharacterized protein n=1 Tax=Lasiosphaeria hispida TaxID=260671 RepID=A0AAJ0HQE5_9PEZI|nr:hypothetical protein B0T25DRAFT_533039 [Lasiosphaeria hispida]